MSLINKISKFFKKNNQGIAPQKEEKINASDYVGKFVQQNGSSIGESIAIERNRVVVKSSDVFISIPLEKIKANAENIVVEDFDREESAKLGKEWFERKDTLSFDKDGMMIPNAPGQR